MGKIKGFLESEQGKDILVVLIVILVGVGSFELGRLSKSDRSGGIKIEYTGLGDLEALQGADQVGNALYGASGGPEPAQIADNANNNTSSKAYFASSRGTKYYPADCSAGQNIKESNRVWFDTREGAEQAGYELSSSCR